MKGFKTAIVLICLLLHGFSIGLAQQSEDYSESWNWQSFEEASGEQLKKAEKAVDNLQFINESQIPKTQPVRYSVIQDDRVLVVYAPVSRRQKAFVFRTTGEFVFGVCFEPDYDGMDIRLSPYDKGILILDWRYLPGPTVTFASETLEVFRFSADSKYSEFPRESRYSAYQESKAKLITDENGKVMIYSESGEAVTLFDHSQEYDAYQLKVDQNSDMNRLMVCGAIVFMLICSMGVGFMTCKK
ncbi:MAG: hypothetical protein IKU34_05925 [Clostridia bacterium]|nr:hypothetical protein [Clostridia bacterium]